MARLDSSSSTLRVSVRSMFQTRLAFSALKGLIGRYATRCASRSLNRICRILYRVSEGGAPCGKRFRRSTSSVYPDRNVVCDMIVFLLICKTTGSEKTLLVGFTHYTDFCGEITCHSSRSSQSCSWNGSSRATDFRRTQTAGNSCPLRCRNRTALPCGWVGGLRAH